MEYIYPKDQKTNGGKQCNSSSRECKTIRERKQNVLPALSIIQGLELSKKQTRLVLQFCLSFKYRNRSRVSIISGPWDDLSPELGINQVTSPGLTQPQLSMICSYYWMEERKLCCVTTWGKLAQVKADYSTLQTFFFPSKKKLYCPGLPRRAVHYHHSSSSSLLLPYIMGKSSTSHPSQPAALQSSCPRLSWSQDLVPHVVVARPCCPSPRSEDAAWLQRTKKFNACRRLPTSQCWMKGRHVLGSISKRTRMIHFISNLDKTKIVKVIKSK